jgi:hypothetical protein
MIEIATLIVLKFSKAAATSIGLRFSNSRNQSLAIAKKRALFLLARFPLALFWRVTP